MIEATQLEVRYSGSRANAVDGVSFLAKKGSLTALAGPNGSGKSSIVRAILGRVPVTNGSIKVSGRDASTYAFDELAREIAVVPQREEGVFPMTVHEYVSLGRYPHLGLWRAPGVEDESAVNQAMEQAGVSELRHRDTSSLSGGEWQRVRISRALAQKTPALVLDEPTTFLDLGHEMAVFELLQSLARSGLAVLLVSHQLNLVARFADDVVVLDRGRVALAGRPDDVMRADKLEVIYDWPLVISRDPAVGAPALVPLRRPHSR